MAAASLGVVLLLWHELSNLSGRPTGVLLALGAASTWALGTQMLRRTPMPVPTLAISFWMTLMTTGVMTVLALVFESDQWVAPTPSNWFAIVFNAVLVFGFAYCLIAMSITIITRNLALGIVFPLLMTSIIEGLITVFASFAKGKMDGFVDALPFANGNAWLTHLPDQPNDGLIFAAWVVGFYLIAAALFFKRDA